MTQAADANRRSSATLLAGAWRRQTRDPAAAACCLPLAVLLSGHMRFDAADPLWPDRDRLLVHPGLAELLRGAARSLAAGAEGGLFHTVAEPVGAGVGATLAERMLATRFGRSLVDHRSWVLADAASLATGPVQEAACLAGAWRLGRLAVLACETDAAGSAAPLGAAPLGAAPLGAAPLGVAGFAAFGWTVRRVVAGDGAGLDGALSACLRSFKPTLLLYASGDEGEAPNLSEPGEAEAWPAVGQRSAVARRSWLKRLARHASRADLEAALACRLAPGWHAKLTDPPWLPASGHLQATAEAVQRAMAEIAPALPNVATLPAEPAGLACGGAAALAGVALHGGVLPMAWHAAAAADRTRPALQEAALTGLRLVELLVERPDGAALALAGLRATPNLLVLRPADATEALECLEVALRHAGASVLMVCATPVPGLAERPTQTRAGRGGYLVAGAQGQRAATLLASGPEVHVAVAARALLRAAGQAVCVVSLPCWTLFAAQDAGWRAHVLGTAPLFGLEASDGFGWERWLGANPFISLLPAPRSLHAGVKGLAETVAQTVLRHLSRRP